MPSSTPPRKFAPVLVEETSKSSRHTPDTEQSPPKPRRFAPEPVEETTRSSKEPRRHGPNDTAPPRRFAPQPVETTTISSKDKKETEAAQDEKPKPRRFAPQPVETTTISSKDKKEDEAAQDDKPKPRRFAPQLVEETEKSSKDQPTPSKKPHIKFAPEVISTTYSSSKNRRAKQQDAPSSSEPMEVEKEKRPPRRFTPILLDTARRVRRAGDPNAPIPQDWRTEYGYHAHSREHWRRVNGEVTPAASEAAVSDDVEMEDAEDESTSSRNEGRREVCALDGSTTRRSNVLKPSRQHSFRLPDLDTIESSESEPESESMASSPSSPVRAPITPSDSTFELFKHATRIRESIDENFTHYLLDLERKKAQQRLEEQALAAYPNPDFGYEPPHHYYVNEDDSDEFEIEDRPVTYDGDEEDEIVEMRRRDSTSIMSYELLQLQQHAEEIQQERNAKGITAPKQEASQAPWGIPPALPTGAADAEMKSMRDRARPPMLGSDLVFPRCKSPDPARFDVTQGSAALRERMCYLTEAAEAERKKTGEDGGLWGVRKPKDDPTTTTKSPETAKPSQPKGLWGGFCGKQDKPSGNRGGLAAPPGPTGLLTPKDENTNPFQLAFNEGRPVGLTTPGTPNKKKKTDLSKLNAVLINEREFDAMMEREYPDSFVTQVYNYLSLGYPSLARSFDEELSKISRISVTDLREDDQKARAAPRGYIRLESDFEGGGGEGTSEESCMRWQALKKYIREWARQEKDMVKDGAGGNFGTVARRGSWAI